MAITASEARKNLFPLIEQVNEDRQPVEITSKRGDTVRKMRSKQSLRFPSVFGKYSAPPLYAAPSAVTLLTKKSLDALDR